MIRVTAFAAAAILLAAVVQPAAAQEVRVKIAGRSETAVEADIRTSARQVCAEQYDYQLGMPKSEDLAQCERITARKAMERFGQAILANAAADRQVATLSSSAKHDRP